MAEPAICTARDPVTHLRCGLYAWHYPATPHRLLRIDYPRMTNAGRIEWGRGGRFAVKKPPLRFRSRKPNTPGAE